MTRQDAFAALKQEASALKALGATDFINKPALWGTLAHRIEFILRAHDTMRALRVSEMKNRAMLQALPAAAGRSIAGRSGPTQSPPSRNGAVHGAGSISRATPG